VTNPPDNTNPVPAADEPRQDSPTTPAVGERRPAWYRRLPGHLGIWVAGLALVAACVIGSCGFIAGAVVSHGFGEHGGSSGDRWGNERQRGGYGPGGGQDNGEYGPGDERAPKQRRGKTPPTPVPSPTVPPTPAQPSTAQPSTPSPAVSPTA
jgi:hypothetical protein